MSGMENYGIDEPEWDPHSNVRPTPGQLYRANMRYRKNMLDQHVFLSIVDGMKYVLTFGLGFLFGWWLF